MSETNMSEAAEKIVVCRPRNNAKLAVASKRFSHVLAAGLAPRAMTRR